MGIQLYEVLGIEEKLAREIAEKVKKSFAESSSPEQWVRSLIEEFDIGPDQAQIFACGWFAGRYAGVSEVMKAVRTEMENTDQKSRYQPPDGYV